MTSRRYDRSSTTIGAFPIAEALWFVHMHDQLAIARDTITCSSGRSITDALEAVGTLMHGAQDHVAHPNFPTWAEHYSGEPDMGDTDENPTEGMLIEAIDESLAWLKRLRFELGPYWEQVLFVE